MLVNGEIQLLALPAEAAFNASMQVTLLSVLVRTVVPSLNKYQTCSYFMRQSKHTRSCKS